MATEKMVPQEPTMTAASDHEMRLKKIEELSARGIEPWPAFEPVTATCKQVVDAFEANGQSAEYAVAGRLMTIRLHGKASFAHIQDRSGKVQIYLKQDHVGVDQFAFFKDMIDVGDIIWCKGTSFKTKTGEVTLEVKAFKLLSKSLFPLPEKFHGLTDIEVKYRQRYLDLIANQETRERFIKRSKIIKQLRAYLDAHDFVEVETPMLHAIPGSAAARPFVTHHNALDQDLYLRIAPELYLKRLVVGGLERVYEINRSFRNEGVSTRHNPEYTMLEFYMAHHDYNFIMTFVEEMLRSVARAACGTLQVPYENYVIDFEKPFARLSMKQSLVVVGGLTQQAVEPDSIDATIKQHAVKLPHSNASYGEKIFALFEALVEKKLTQPTFITEYPVEVSPLAKRDAHNPEITARFELFAGGIELGNGFNELNDPFDQAARFKQQAEAHDAGDEEAHHYDKDYIHALEHGLPPTVGVGIGVDRLTMFLTNTPSIKEVILFPTLKRKDA